MKEPIDILLKHCKNFRGHYVGMIQENIIKAMEEYAKIYHKERKIEEARIENGLIRFFRKQNAEKK